MQQGKDVPSVLAMIRRFPGKKVPVLAVLAGCSARRSERRVASHTSEEGVPLEHRNRNAPASTAKTGIFFSGNRLS